mmetsp:Transcript_8921/g.10220  ORF Transcript_8921/g.10220 Transcript_8921/m.10220 type:complete len:920 (+) Transcript_8921:136-2895(+)
MSDVKSFPEYSYKDVFNIDDAKTALSDKQVEALHVDEFPDPVGGPNLGKFLDALFKNKTLLALKISRNKIDQNGAQKFAQLLTHNYSLQHFELRENFIQLEGVESLSLMLRVNKSLVSLSLVQCGLEFMAVSAIASQLEKNNRTLLRLDLSSNQIEDAGAKKLAKVFPINNILSHVNLSFNNIGESGGESLLSALKQKHKQFTNFSLCELVLTGNKVGNAVHEIDVLLGKNLGSQREAFTFASDYAHVAPLRTTKVLLVGRDKSGKSSLLDALIGESHCQDYYETFGIASTPVLARIDGSEWERHGIKPLNGYCPDFLARFANIYLDKQKKEETEQIKAENANKRNSVQRVIAAVTTRRASATKLDIDRQSISGRGSTTRRGSVFRDVVDIFTRKKNPRLNDEEYQFHDIDNIDVPSAYTDEEVEELFRPEVLGKARRERDNIGFIVNEFSGLKTYYSLYHAFLTQSGIYVVTFDLEQLLINLDEQMDTLRYLNYWIKAIRYNSPGASVMFVGTRFDSFKKKDGRKVKEYVEATNVCLKEITERIFPEVGTISKDEKLKKLAESFQLALSGGEKREVTLIKNKEKDLLFFPVDLKTGEGVAQVRSALDEAAPEQLFFKTPIPARFVKFLDSMRAMKRPWIEKEVVKKCSEGILESDEELQQALNLFNSVGYIMHITNIKSYRDCVVLDPSWLFENTTKVLSIASSMNPYNATVEAAGLKEDLVLYSKTGKLSRDILLLLWGEENFNFLLKYMEQNLIMSRWGFQGPDEDGSKTRYIVTSAVPMYTGSRRIKVEENLECVFNFNHALTLGVYERIACQVVQSTLSANPDSPAPELFFGYSKHYFGNDFVFHLERTPDTIKCYIDEYHKAPIKCVSKLLKMFGKVRDLLGEGMEFNTTLKIGQEKYEAYEVVKEQKLGLWC